MVREDPRLAGISLRKMRQDNAVSYSWPIVSWKELIQRERSEGSTFPALCTVPEGEGGTIARNSVFR